MKVIWSRTFFSAWWATLDGRPAPTVLADGHLLGVPVPAGAHRVEIGWSSRPVAAGGVLLAVGLGPDRDRAVQVERDRGVLVGAAGQAGQRPQQEGRVQDVVCQLSS